MLGDVDRWWNEHPDRTENVDKAELYELLRIAAQEVEAAWSALTDQPDGTRTYHLQPDDDRLPVVSIQVFEIEFQHPNIAGAGLVVWDVRFTFRRSQR